MKYVKRNRNPLVENAHLALLISAMGFYAFGDGGVGNIATYAVWCYAIILVLGVLLSAKKKVVYIYPEKAKTTVLFHRCAAFGSLLMPVYAGYFFIPSVLAVMFFIVMALKRIEAEDYKVSTLNQAAARAGGSNE